jgi:hypothetical protein
LSVVVLAGAVTVWVLNNGKADDAAPPEVARQDPVVSPAQKDVVSPAQKDDVQGSNQGRAEPGEARPPEHGDDAESEKDGADAAGASKVATTRSDSGQKLEKGGDDTQSDTKQDKPVPEETPSHQAATEEAAEEPKEAVAGAPEAALPPFDQAAAKAALGAAAAQASTCRKGDDPPGNAEVMITFAPSGRVTSANVAGGPFAGTATGGCVASTLRRAKVPAFSGNHVTVRKVVRLQ